MAGTTTYELREISPIEMNKKKENNYLLSDSDYYSDDICYFMIDRHSSRIYFEYAFETSGLVLTLNYWKKNTDLNTDGDTTVITDPDVLVEYAAAKGRQKRDKQARPDLSEFKRKLLDMLKHEKSYMAQPTGFRQPVQGLNAYIDGVR